MKGCFIAEFLLFIIALILIPVAGILVSIYLVGAFLIALIFKKRSRYFTQVLQQLRETYESLLDA